ncbi:hypothetical protein Dsin_008481 [Dipteronia sinensis]|uniref:RNase H type-1 domain-containing protein n=1 Tax=Dipteronia sinensis TaxID=43782 RepID=A0AAE0ANL7_9ROSI|nr:hypothetical protein Dsin_008481 [Dipteronia sinensis]
MKASNMVRFRVAWWFKTYGNGSGDPITLIRLDIAERCKDPDKVKIKKLGEWIPPLHDVLKFNVDGSARGSPGQAGIEGVLRDQDGNVLRSLSTNIGWQDAITAEIRAIDRACELCASKTELMGKRIIISSDSMTVVSWINSCDLGNINHTHFIYKIRRVLFDMGQVSVEYSSRATNFLADSLAKKKGQLVMGIS